jgi:hypothetical protein
MPPAWVILLCALLVVAGCGGGADDEAPAEGAESTATPAAERCADADALRARDLIGSPPQGFEVVRGDRKAIDAYVGQYRKFLRDRWRGYDARIVVRRGAESGVAVIVMNSSEDVGPASEILGGAEEAERDAGRDAGVQPIDVAGEEGVFAEAPDGAFIAVARAGSCAVVVLTADSAPILREVASMLQPA